MYNGILWFCFAFLWSLMMLNIISCAYWSFVYHWGNIYSGPLYIKKKIGTGTIFQLVVDHPPPCLQVGPPFFQSRHQSSLVPWGSDRETEEKEQPAVAELQWEHCLGAEVPSRMQNKLFHPFLLRSTKSRCAGAKGRARYTF